MVKPHPDRLQAAWDLLQEPPSDEETVAEIEHLAKLAPDALDRELEESGFDLRQVEANAERLRQRLHPSAPEAPAAGPEPAARPEPPRTAPAVDAAAPRGRSPRRRGDYVSGAVLGALVLALTVGFLLRPRGDREAPIARPDVPSIPSPPSPSTTPSSVPPEAVTLRIGATAACKRAEWQDCLDLLDRAAKLDPAGDAAPEIRALRERAADSTPRPAPKNRPKP